MHSHLKKFLQSICQSTIGGVIIYCPWFKLLISWCAMCSGYKRCREFQTILLSILYPSWQEVACAKQMPQLHPALVNGTCCGLISRSSQYKLWYTPPQLRDCYFLLKAYLLKPRLVATSTNFWPRVSSISTCVNNSSPSDNHQASPPTALWLENSSSRSNFQKIL